MNQRREVTLEAALALADTPRSTMRPPFVPNGGPSSLPEPEAVHCLPGSGQLHPAGDGAEDEGWSGSIRSDTAHVRLVARVADHRRLPRPSSATRSRSSARVLPASVIPPIGLVPMDSRTAQERQTAYMRTLGPEAPLRPVDPSERFPPQAYEPLAAGPHRKNGRDEAGGSPSGRPG